MAKKSTSIVLVAGILSILAMEAGNSKAATIYVPDDYSTIQAAVDAASPGDTIIVRDGTYTENVKVNKNNLTIRSQNAAQVTVLQGSGSTYQDPFVHHLFEVTADYVEISGFTAKGSGSGIYLSAAHCKISDNVVLNNGYGILLYRSSHDNTLTNNTITSNGGEGIYLLNSDNNILTDNTVVFNRGSGILLETSHNNVLTNNLLHDICLACANNNTLINNTASNSYGGIYFLGSNNNILTDNTFASNQYGIFFERDSRNNILRKNALLNNLYGIYTLYESNKNLIYLNNFMNNSHSVCFYFHDSDNTWESPEVSYSYGLNTYTRYLGNYWHDYTGTDADGDGIGDTLYPIDGDSDNYPLIMPFENYEILIEAPPPPPPAPGYAIIVAGKGGWREKWALDHGANNAYRVLRNLGFDDNHIFYLNSTRPQDVDEDGEDEVDAPALLSNFENVISQIRGKMVTNSIPLILYMAGHGLDSPACFVFDEEQDQQGYLWVNHLNNMLGEFPSETPMLIMIGSCYSGIFITSPDGISSRNRIIITGTHDDKKRWSLLGLNFALSSDRFWGNLNKGVNVKEAFVENALLGDIRNLWVDDNGDRIGHPPNNLGDDGTLAASTSIGEPGTENLELTPWLFVWKHSPGELRLYDSQNQVTGLVNGEVQEEILNSIYDEQNEIVAIFYPLDNYRYQVVGTEQGMYGLDVHCIDDGHASTFEAVDIPTSPGAVHQYTVDWQALSAGQEGVDMDVDSDGDGLFEQTITSGPTLQAPVNIEQHVKISVGRAAYDRRTGQFSVDVKITNNSQTVIGSPVWFVIESISNPAVTLAGADGTTIDGKPYVDLSGLLGNGQLDPAETISKRIYFNNPKRVQFTFKPSVRGVILP